MKNIDAFSWRRVSMVANYYSPRIRRQLMFYPLISLVAFALGMITYNPGEPASGLWVTGLLQYFVIFGPLALAFHRDWAMSITLPAGSAEKATFLAIYSIIVLPVLAMAPCEIALNLVYDRSLFVTDPAMVDPEVAAVLPDAAKQRAQNILGLLFSTAVCMWVVMKTRRHVVLKAIGFILLFGLVFGFVVGIMSLFNSGITEAAASAIRLHSSSAVPPAMKVIIKEMITISTYLSAAGIILFVLLTYRAAARRELR
ncbi:MAG: hypothetical protein MRZ32_09285 [Bacteroidales bacterium]|nr:hypothetical protein [Bacteroidales bacterium]